jgi:hypothetical protein
MLVYRFIGDGHGSEKNEEIASKIIHGMNGCPT